MTIDNLTDEIVIFYLFVDSFYNFQSYGLLQHKCSSSQITRERIHTYEKNNFQIELVPNGNA